MKRWQGAVAVLGLALVVGADAREAGRTKGASVETLQVTSAAFNKGGPIPKKCTCDDADASPPLMWSAAPAATKSFALIVDDPDAPAGTWVHWVIYDLPADARGLSAGMSKQAELADGARQGTNDFRKTGYNGPCPPPGKPHRYFFKVYALDTRLGLKGGASKPDVEKAMRGHILAQGELVGLYAR